MIQFGREICGHPPAALRREWLVTNGAGGYAMGSLLANAPTRKYHGYLVAALQPPLGRTMLVGGLQIYATYLGQRYELSGFEYADGSLSNGYKHLEQWMIDSMIPIARFSFADALIEQFVWMQDGANTTYVRFQVVRASAPIELELHPLITERDHHETTIEPTWQPTIEPIDHGALVTTPNNMQFKLLSDIGTWQTNGTEWLEDIHYRGETERGHDDTARLLIAGSFSATLQRTSPVTLVFSTEDQPNLDGLGAMLAESERHRHLLEQANLHQDAPDWIKHLVLAADQFLVRRDVQLPDGTIWHGWSILAGYPWFSDWGRDTMIAIPGLLVATGRVALAADVLRTWSKFLSKGMLPNRFPDIGDEPEYNTVDATLWFFQAIRSVYQSTKYLSNADLKRINVQSRQENTSFSDLITQELDERGHKQLIADLYPLLVEIVQWHQRGTRYSIKVDTDGLLMAGEPDVQLTWMDVKYKGWVVTPRQGKAVEINALWYSALRTLAEFARDLDKATDAEMFEQEAERVKHAFARFWNPKTNCLYDVLDTPNGDDATIRPNQLFALSVAHSPLDPSLARSVLDVCAQRLLTSYGLRSLDPADPQYIGRYGGDLGTRDAAYHQGTAWAWLMGAFIGATHRIYGKQQTQMYLLPIINHLRDAGIGSISEIFTGDEPFTPCGCPWQAWSVAEVLRCWRENDL